MKPRTTMHKRGATFENAEQLNAVLEMAERAAKQETPIVIRVNALSLPRNVELLPLVRARRNAG